MANVFMDNLRQLFADSDTDQNGSLGREEFAELCSKIGLNREAANETFARLDVDKDNKITFDEFAAGFNKYSKQGGGGGLLSSSPTCSSPALSGSSLSASASSSPSPQPVASRPRPPPRFEPTPSPAAARARSRASPNGTHLSLGSTASSAGSATNLTWSGRSATSASSSSGGGTSTHLFSVGGDQLPQADSPADELNGAGKSSGGCVVYSSDLIGDDFEQASGGSGQFGSMLSSNSSFNQLKTMQDLLDCVQKLQNENQILSQIFFKDKREREEYISQLGEEFDQQLKEVEERANKKAREELENEKKRLSEMMQTERETLQHHYQTLERMSKLVKSPNGRHLDDGDTIDKVKLKLEDTFMENRQLKRSLLDTKSDVALIWKEMEKLKKQYEDKLSSAYEKHSETKNECDHIKQQLNLMKDSNRKLQDASDVITNYITDKVEPVIKVALDEDGEFQSGNNNNFNSLNSSLRLGAASATNSRRGSILSEYLNGAGGLSVDDCSPPNRRPSSTGDLESFASSSRDTTTSSNDKSNSSGSPVVAAADQQKQQQVEAAQSAAAQVAQSAANSGGGGLRSISRRLQIGTRAQSEAKAKELETEARDKETAVAAAAAKTKLADVKSASADQVDEIIIEPADGPSKATFNIILVGDSFVGKSSFAARFIEGSFVQGLISNCSIDFKTKTYKVDGINYTVNLWDTAGQERFRSITASYFRKADGIILMYDVTDKRSYLNVRNWMSTISDTAAENVAVLLVGNKIDLRHKDNMDKCVPTEEGFRLAKEYDIVFLETSVKTGTNLLPSMGRLIRLIAKNTAAVEDEDLIRLNDKSRTSKCMPKNC